MNITIAGYGFVGKGYEKLIIDNNQECSVTISDPAFLIYDNGIPSDTDAVVICVATPQQEDGSCYMGHVKDVIKESPNVPILIKSTICLEGWRELRDMFPDNNISFSPEFLRQDFWVEDISSMKSILIGGDDFVFWSGIFNILECVESEVEALIMTKYAKNNFLALKVSFFNQLYDLCNKLGVSYDEVRKHTTSDSRIGESHSYISHERGFGGHCFPKDTAALVKTSEKYGSFLSIMDCARSYNNEIREN
jgi:UDPglucose 6-dehydrogenase